MPDPEDPITLLAEGAAQLHELFLAYLNAGFTEPQALFLLGQMLQASIKGATG
ncbi:hypothetical protein ACIBCT_21145 [Streptosporangium sp. NPDC050855]|uniref:hypothetical protein n=1 Tax=Streptosporangium sp. NPDC050855 TaxID=3366194 RepID=UPI0037A096BE